MQCKSNSLFIFVFLLNYCFMLLYLFQTIYLNGEIEKLTLQKLDILLRAETWVKQVLLIQGFVPTYSASWNIFTRTEGTVECVLFSLIVVVVDIL